MNYISRLSGVLPVLAGVVLALSVFGCGGGDGATTQTPTAPAAPEAPSDPSPAATTRNDIIRNAATNRPVAGSVSQGSRQDQDEQGVVTQDSVTWNGNGGNNIRVSVGSIQAQPYQGSSNDNILEGVNSPDGVISLVTDPDSGAASSAIVQVVSDMRFNTEDTSGEFTPTFSGNSDNPDLVFGLWATANADNDITAIGAFADGAETPSAAIPTSGTYTGNLFAFYQNFDGDSEAEAAYSVARVELTVGTNGVSGRVFDIADKDSPDSDSFTFINPGAGGAIVVTMAPATPLSSQNGGFFNGTTTLSRDDSTISEGEGVDDSTGRWGGQFFGSDGRYIAGTIGLNIDYSDGTSSTVFGSFSATRDN